MPTTLLDVPIGKIKPHPSNIRSEVGDLTELAASITQKGILEPLIVVPDTRPRAAADQYLLIAGHRRHAAAKRAGSKTVPCLVRDDLTEASDQIEAMLAENLQRRDITPVEESRAYQALLEFPGYTMKRITERTGRSAKTVRERVSLGKLPTERLDQVQAGQLSLEQAHVFVEFANDPVATDELDAAAGGTNWRWTVERLRRARLAAKLHAKKLKELTAAGVTIVSREQLDQLAPAEEGDEAWGYVSDFIDSLATSEELEAAEGGIDDPDDAARWEALEVAKHAACPGHAAFDAGIGSSLSYVCTAPHLHSRADVNQPVGLNALDAERVNRELREAEAADRKQLMTDLAIAATVRTEFLAEHVAVANDTDTMVQLVARAMVKRAAFPEYSSDGQVRKELVAKLLRDLGMREDLERHIDRLTVGQCIIVLDVLEFARPEQALSYEHAWDDNRTGESVRIWRQRLEHVYGHQWSDIEQRLLDEAEARNAPTVVDTPDLAEFEEKTLEAASS